MTANSSSKMAFKRKKGEMPSRFEHEAEGADLGRREKTYRSDLIAALAESSDSDREPEDPIRAAIVQRRKRANEEVGKHSKHEEEPQTLRDVEEEDEEGDEEEVENYAPTHKNIAKMLISDLRLHMEKLSRAVQEGGQRHDVLEFWRSMKEIPPEVSFLGPTFSETARAILTIQLSSASSERRVKALKHILTNERTHLGNVTAEDILVVRDWIKQETFTKDRFNFLIKRINEFVLENK